ncbi:MobA/MobL family protein [Phenylobacterium sp. LjRoot164]|uniref:MobQ family relaxase n=1 Tax=unclassified Phenylobacterium TaxID=2640670 RepID=UPI003ECF7D1C
MAQYRLEVQAIKRAEGRSAVAAAAYRSASRLHDERLEMAFDYASKGGVVVAGIMLPDGAPGAYGDRQALWNAAEAADRRVDSRTAREVLVSLPHELNDEQRHALLRDFIAQGLVAKGMIADYAIHRPDGHGDPRNHHAHIMVTTRMVGPEGFGPKGRAWDNPEAVRALRALFADVQNQHLREHLGPEAPQVSHLSLADQGLDREPTVHLGPAASGMERRGESSDRGDTNRRVRDRNEERETAPKAVRDLEDRLAASHPRQAYPIDAVIREFEAIHQTMVRERDGWVRESEKAVSPQVLRGAEVAREVIGDTARRRLAARHRLRRSEAQIAAGRMRRESLARWVSDPARMIWARHAELNRLERARSDYERASAAYAVRQQWLKSDDGRAYVAGRLAPGRQAAEEARRAARTLERKIKRADRRIEGVARTRVRLLVARELGHERLVAPSQLRAGIGQAVREVDRRVAGVLRAHAPEAQRTAMNRVMRLVRGQGPAIER